MVLALPGHHSRSRAAPGHAPLLADRPLFDRITGWLSLAQAGRPSIALLHGDAGMGKSHLAAAAAEEAERRGFEVATARGYVGEPPTLLISRVARQLGLDDDGESVARLIRAIRLEINARVRERRPLALIFEDVHHYDAADLALVQDLVFEPPDGPCFLLLTVRTAADRWPGAEHLSAFMTALAAASQVDVLQLPRLGYEEAVRLVEGRSPAVAAPRFIRDLVTMSGGNPLYLTCLLEAVTALEPEEQAQVFSGSRALDTLPTPAPAAAVIPHRFGSLDAEARRVLHALAVWGMPASPPLLASLVGMPLSDLEEQLDRPQVAGYLCMASAHDAQDWPLAFRESLAARVFLADAPPHARRRLHEHAAELLEECVVTLDGDELVVLASHYLDGALPVDDARIQRIAAAATHLVEHSRYRTAGDLLRRLVARVEREQGMEHVPRDVFVLLAETCSRAGAWDDARRALEQATSLPPASGETQFRARLRTARDHIAVGKEREALAIYRAMLSDDRPLASRARAQLLIDIAAILNVLGRPDEAVEASNEAVAAATAAGDDGLAAIALLPQHLERLMAGRPAEALVHAQAAYRLAHRGGSAKALARSTSGIGGDLCDTASLGRGVRWLQRSFRLAERCDDYAAASWAGLRLASAYLDLGDLRAADETASLVVHIDASLHRLLFLRRSRAMNSLVNALRGQRDAPLPADGGFDDPGEGSNAEDTVWIMAARFEQQLLAGEYDEASESIRRAHQVLRASPTWRRLLVAEVLPRRATIAGLTGDRETLLATTREFERYEAEIGDQFVLVTPELTRTRGLLAADEERWGEAAGLLREAANAFEAIDYHWRAALARKDAGRMLAVHGDHEGAAALLEEAFVAFDRMGAAPHLERTRALLHGIGRRAPRDPAPGSALTRRERQVAELAAEGLMDAEIAVRLSIRRRTVTTHMHNLLKKLALHSRVELRARLDQHGDGFEA